MGKDHFRCIFGLFLRKSSLSSSLYFLRRKIGKNVTEFFEIGKDVTACFAFPMHHLFERFLFVNLSTRSYIVDIPYGTYTVYRTISNRRSYRCVLFLVLFNFKNYYVGVSLHHCSGTTVQTVRVGTRYSIGQSHPWQHRWCSQSQNCLARIFCVRFGTTGTALYCTVLRYFTYIYVDP